jgi:hypothetical protein
MCSCALPSLTPSDAACQCVAAASSSSSGALRLCKSSLQPKTTNKTQTAAALIANSRPCRLDKAHGVCTVSHLRLSADFESSATFARSLVERLSCNTVGSGSSAHVTSSQHAALQHLALAIIGDQGLPPLSSTPHTSTSRDMLVTSLLSTAFGPNRRKFLRMLSSPDIDRTRRDALAALQASQDVVRRAVAAVRALGDPIIAPLLLAWLLREESRLGVEAKGLQEGQQGRESGGGHDVTIERMVSSLPLTVTNDPRVRAALQCSCLVRGDLISRLLQLRARENKAASWVQAVAGLGWRDAAALVWLYACTEWSVLRSP